MPRQKREWIMVRLQRKTADRLRDLGALWQSQWFKGNMKVPGPNDRWGYSLDHVIAELLGRDESHRVRARNQVSRRRRRTEQTQGEEVPPPGRGTGAD